MLLKMKHLAFAICLLGVSSGAIAKVSLVKSQNNVEEYQLDNGLRVILAPNDKQDRVYMNVVYFTGSLDDPKGKGGLAHLLEHLLFKGTQNIQGEEFQRRLDQHTLMTNAMTSFHYTQYINVMRAEQKNIDMLLEMEAERMDKSVIQMEHVPNEIEIVKREREIRLDQPFSVVQDQIFKELYGNQSLGRAPIGDLAELQSINLNELQQFYKTWYKPNNAALILSGKFDKQAVLAQVEKQFAHIPAAASFPDRAIHHIPTLDMAKLKNRQYTVKKGSQYSTFIGYMGGENKQIQDALSFADALFTTEPSGRLYQNLVKTKQATGVGGGARLENQYNFVLLGANFSPKHDHQQVEQTIIQQVEQGGKVSDEEVNRVRKTLQNLLKQTENDAVAFGSLLASYVAEQNDGSWTKYYQDLETLKTISAQEINGVYQQFFTPERRLVIDIEPTPEEQKQAQQQTQQAQTLKSLQEQKAEPLKDASVYLAEQQQLLQDARTAVAKIEPKIQRGQFKNGLKYAYYQTPMRDDKVYATITLGLGDVRALWGQNANLGLMAGQLIRASQQYNLQQIQDKSIDVNGGVSSIIPAKNNRMTITIHADKQHFADYFAFILQLIQNPAFDAEDYEVNRNKSLQALDRSYSEPATVAALTLQRMTEHYQPQDIRFSAEPEVSKAQLQASTRDDVVALYKKFFAMNHADIAISGEFDQAKIHQLVSNSLAKWNTKQPYQRALAPYQRYTAKKVHALAEQREFGAYQAALTFPVGIEHSDAPAMLVLSQILGGSQLSSRLAYELREKNNLTYGFGHQFILSNYQNSGLWSVSANYVPSQAEQVSQAVHKTIQDLREKGVTEQEVQAAKADLLKRRVSALDNERSVHNMLNAQLDLNRDMQSRLQRDQAIANVSKADVDAVILKYLDVNQLLEVMADQYGKEIEFKAQ